LDATVPVALFAAPNAFRHFGEFFMNGLLQSDGIPVANDLAFKDWTSCIALDALLCAAKASV